MSALRGFRPRSKSTHGVARITRDHYGPKWYSVVNEISKRDEDCLICGKPVLQGQKWETHHLRPITRSGTTTKANLAKVHSWCHDARHPHLAKKNR